jgi:predicted transcriptional regulator
MEITQETGFLLEPQEMRILRIGQDEIEAVCKALKSPTRLKILKILRKKPMDVSRIAKELGQTEANVSAQIQHLQKANLVSCRYTAGDHGVRKICDVIVDKIIIDLL